MSAQAPVAASVPAPTQLTYSTLSELAKSVAAPLPLVAYPPLGSRQMLSPEVRTLPMRLTHRL